MFWQSRLGNKACQIKPVVLLVLDGWGLAPPSEGNAVFLAKTPNYDRYLEIYPYAELIASGESVGLPANEVGNTEVGHLTMGAGRTMYQDLVRINKAIESEAFYVNPAFLQAVEHTRQHQSKLHVMGLASTGSVHSAINHLYALLEMAKRQGVRVYLHLFLDGRDAHPNEGVKVIGQLQEYLQTTGVGVIATLAGRYYAMDRDRRWERTQAAYEAIVEGKGDCVSDPIQAIQQAYGTVGSDEFVRPTVIVNNQQPLATVDDNDAVIFFNFRVDRPKQLTAALVVDHFEALRNFVFEGTPDEKQVVEFEGTFTRNKRVRNLVMTTMTEYHKGLPVDAVAFAPEIVVNGLIEILSKNGLAHLKMSESEKERFVTYYFDGMNEGGFPGGEVKIIHSPKVATYDLKPEMSVHKLTAEFERRMKQCKYHFAVMNFANPDMVAHTGNLQATIKALEEVDKALGRVERLVTSLGGLLMVTADHGNAEELKSFPQGSFFYTTSEGGVNTEHSNNKVPVIFITPAFRGKAIKLADGALGDIAPTILTYMGLTVPSEMTGRDLLGVAEGGNNQKPISNNQ